MFLRITDFLAISFRVTKQQHKTVRRIEEAQLVRGSRLEFHCIEVWKTLSDNLGIGFPEPITLHYTTYYCTFMDMQNNPNFPKE